jgi:hypothetical protein
MLEKDLEQKTHNKKICVGPHFVEKTLFVFLNSFKDLMVINFRNP